MSQTIETDTAARIEVIRPERRSPLARVGASARELVLRGVSETAAEGVRVGRRPKFFGLYGLILSFVVLVLVPTLVAGWYFAFVASDVFVSESKFAVRGSTEKLPSSSANYSLMSSLTMMNSNQDAYIVVSFIQSLPLLERLQKEENLRGVFTRAGVDSFSRLDEKATAEELRAYWNKMVSAYVDTLSGVVNLEVSAFTAADALTLSRAIIAAGEELVNDISRRKRADALKFANEEVARGEARLKAARIAIQDFRNESGALDPIKSAEATAKITLALRSERVTLENELATARRSLSDASPSVQVLSARLNALNGQITQFDRLLTDQGGGGSGGDRVASRVLSRYEGLQLEREFSEKYYVTVLSAAESARVEADRQQLYLVTFVPPELAQMPLYPRRLGSVVTVFFVATALWSILSLLVAAVRDHDG